MRGAAIGNTVEWFDFAVYSELAPAYYDTVAAIISLATVLTMRETAARPLRKRVTA